MRNQMQLILTFFVAASLYSCQKDKTLLPEQQISDEVLGQIKALGFGTSDVQKHEDGYLVEGDIILTPAMLASSPDRKALRIADVEQYNTFELVTGLPRVIKVAVSGTVSAAFSTSVDNALARYNAQNLRLTFQRVAPTASPNITLKIVNTGQYIASGGFPTGGNPYSEIKYAKKYTSGYSDGFMTTVVAHEIGHCIGFRHTDYMNRAYSCGTGGNEGQETTGVGAVLIPGTPSSPDAASWMLACLGASTNRPFNANDVTALNYLY